MSFNQVNNLEEFLLNEHSSQVLITAFKCLGGVSSSVGKPKQQLDLDVRNVLMDASRHMRVLADKRGSFPAALDYNFVTFIFWLV